jgi:PDZ domain
MKLLYICISGLMTCNILAEKSDDITYKIIRAEVIKSNICDHKISIVENYYNSKNGDWLILRGEQKNSLSLKEVENLKPSEVLYGIANIKNEIYNYYQSIGTWVKWNGIFKTTPISSKLSQDPDFIRMAYTNKDAFQKLKAEDLIKLLSNSSYSDANNTMNLKIADKNNTIYDYIINKNGEIISMSAVQNSQIVKYEKTSQIPYLDVENYIQKFHTSNVPKRKYFIPLDNFLKNYGSDDRFGFSIVKTNNDIIVKNVLVNSLAARSGLKPGMKILEISGNPINNKTDILSILKKIQNLACVNVISVSEDGFINHNKIDKIPIDKIAVDNLIEVDEVIENGSEKVK